MPSKPRRLIIVSGLSGAGKTIVLNSLEDLGIYCIDNLPITLLDEFVNQLSDPTNSLPQEVGVGIDARDPAYDFTTLSNSIDKMNQGNISVELVFIEAADDVLTKRFSETRRKHPLSSDEISLSDAIKKERLLMEPLSARCDIRIDTSHSLLHQLRNTVRKRIAKHQTKSLSLQFLSFGFKNGIPQDADFVFDVRCLPNPHWERNLRPFTGLDKPVADFLSAQDKVIEMLNDTKQFLERWIKQFEEDNRSYLTIAIGCTGGQHRSVFLAKELSDHFINLGKNVILRHRDTKL